MSREVKLSELETVLGDFDYPVDRSTVAAATDDVTLQLADGQENLGETIGRSNNQAFETPDDLANEVMNLLPRHAVGEPYQSEGEG